MVSKLPHEFRKFNRNKNHIRRIFKETKHVLESISLENFFPGENIVEDLLPATTLDKVNNLLNNNPAIVIFGQNNKAKATLVNHILSTELLPTYAGTWRWMKITHGPTNYANLTLGLEYEVVDYLTENDKTWVTLTAEQLTENDNVDPCCPHVLEIKLNQPMLKDGVQIFVLPDCKPNTIRVLTKNNFKLLPVFLYALGEEVLSSEAMDELRMLRETYPNNPVLFVSALTNLSLESLDSADLTKSEQRRLLVHSKGWSDDSNSIITTEEDSLLRSCSTQYSSVKSPTRSRLNSVKEQDDEGLDLEQINSLGLTWMDQLTSLGFMGEPNDVDHSAWLDQERSMSSDLLDSCTKPGKIADNNNSEPVVEIHRMIVQSYLFLDKIVYFIRGCLQNYLVNVSNELNDVHTTSLRKFMLSAFDMAREIQITPVRISYAQKKEYELYYSLMSVVNAKQQEITELMHTTIQEMLDEVQSTPKSESKPGSSQNNDQDKVNASDVYKDDHKAEAADEDEINPVDGNHDKKKKIKDDDDDEDDDDDDEDREWTATVRAATAEVQRRVLSRLGDRVARQMIESVNCLRETFVGTLQRCLQSLEKSYDHETSLTASEALAQILSAAYTVNLQNSSPTLVHSFLERVRQLLKSVPLPWAPTPVLNKAWRQRVTVDVLNSLSPPRLARAIALQFRDKVKASHDTFQQALRSLENHYSGKLERTEEQRVAIRKYHAPRIAKLALESTSMSDMVRYGIPHQGKEIGRGQYGIVFACDGWGGAPGPCAIKSVVPPDEKHWNDLAMEFYFTRSIPDHKRILKLRGSVIDHTYGSGNYGCGAAVLLITDRMSRDLYCGIRSGLTWLERVQISIDVLEGIRYLHSQGLVHRDIKLKNVLLDTENRAKLTDLGFCITEAMMSGSIVGTPVHMAPELLTGHYDASVDIYAFGILFWYVCAGHVRLPYAFEQFHNKEQLWTSVRKGIRPERLIVFDDECWNLMEQCWAGDPAKRPHLGAILPVLESIYVKAEMNAPPQTQAMLTGNSPDSTTKHRSKSSVNNNNRFKSIADEVNNRNNNIKIRQAMELLQEPNNLRGEAPSPAFLSKRRSKKPMTRTPKHPGFFHASACSNLYIQMQEF
ncbi:unnamed protein product [Trichogramma brassicae]|uniref:Dual serine/threonine and tyrosine protein kinase n=1 Tax=Trichogramma brassicae TaxID=86971 RepID=A0A6H5I373_9HYME|nr:unnamed protein product [Trichogramma brassicae]